jgi:hypothetical protein
MLSVELADAVDG